MSPQVEKQRADMARLDAEIEKAMHSLVHGGLDPVQDISDQADGGETLALGLTGGQRAPLGGMEMASALELRAEEHVLSLRKQDRVLNDKLSALEALAQDFLSVHVRQTATFNTLAQTARANAHKDTADTQAARPGKKGHSPGSVVPETKPASAEKLDKTQRPAPELGRQQPEARTIFGQIAVREAAAHLSGGWTEVLDLQLGKSTEKRDKQARVYTHRALKTIENRICELEELSAVGLEASEPGLEGENEPARFAEQASGQASAQAAAAPAPSALIPEQTPGHDSPGEEGLPLCVRDAITAGCSGDGASFLTHWGGTAANCTAGEKLCGSSRETGLLSAGSRSKLLTLVEDFGTEREVGGGSQADRWNGNETLMQGQNDSTLADETERAMTESRRSAVRAHDQACPSVLPACREAAPENGGKDGIPDQTSDASSSTARREGIKGSSEETGAGQPCEASEPTASSLRTDPTSSASRIPSEAVEGGRQTGAGAGTDASRGPRPERAATDLPAPWTKHVTSDGTAVYYYNADNDQSVAHLPPEIQRSLNGAAVEASSKSFGSWAGSPLSTVGSPLSSAANSAAAGSPDVQSQDALDGVDHVNESTAPTPPVSLALRPQACHFSGDAMQSGTGGGHRNADLDPEEHAADDVNPATNGVLHGPDGGTAAQGLRARGDAPPVASSALPLHSPVHKLVGMHSSCLRKHAKLLAEAIVLFRLGRSCIHTPRRHSRHLILRFSC